MKLESHPAQYWENKWRNSSRQSKKKEKTPTAHQDQFLLIKVNELHVTGLGARQYQRNQFLSASQDYIRAAIYL